MNAIRYQADILARFQAVLERDQDKHIAPWMISWAYQDRKSSKYAAELPQDFGSFEGPHELLRWFNWMSSAPRPNYIDRAVVGPLIDISRSTDERIYDALGLDFPSRETYDATIGATNAQDYHFPRCYPTPARQSVGVLLDFGAGYGRQANLWVNNDPEVTYVAVDAIPLSYCLQHVYYSHLGTHFADYVVDPDGFIFEPETPGIYHVPTWRLDLLPDDSFDMISCVQVLPELGRKLLQHAIGHFYRILRPGGALYLRDHDRQWRPGHGLNTNRILSKLGFELEFHPQVIDREEVWGVPRVWRKAHPAVLQSRQRSVKGALRDWASVADHLTNGRLRRVAATARKTVRRDTD